MKCSYRCFIAIVILLWCRLWQSYSSLINDTSDIVILNFDLIDALNTHHISFLLSYHDKNISLTVMNECLSYQLYPPTCVQLFRYIIQSQLSGNHILTSKDISHQHQYFTRLVLVQELLYSSFNLYDRRNELSKEKLGR